MKYLASRLAGFFIAVTLLLSSLLGYGITPALAAVGLTSFEVAPGNNNSELVVTWVTETEVDTLAFQLKRATVQDPNVATQVANLQALGAGVGGGTYEHRDPNLTSGTRYFYWLYEVTSGGDIVLLTAPISGTPGQAGATPTATPTATNRPATATPTVTRIATSVPTATQPAGNAPTTNTPVPTDTPVATNTPIPTTTSLATAATAAANLPVSTDTPETPAQTTPATSSTDTVPPESQPAPVTDGETAPASDTGQGERSDQEPVDPSAPTAQVEDLAPTGLNSVDTATAQAVAENNAQVTAAAPESQPAAARPTATPRPSRSDDSGGTTGLLAVIGGGSLCAAALLALVAFFIWRRR